MLVRSIKQIPFVSFETGFLCEIGCGDSARVIYLFARAVQQLGLWTQKLTSQRRLLLCLRREETHRVQSFGHGLKHPSLL